MEGLEVVFSGHLKDSEQDFGNFSHIYYAKLSDIKVIEN